MENSVGKVGQLTMRVLSSADCVKVASVLSYLDASYMQGYWTIFGSYQAGKH